MKAFHALCMLSVASLAIQTVSARLVKTLSYEELMADADIVAIVEPVESTEANDAPPFLDEYRKAENYVAKNTRFRVLSVLKGDMSTTGDLILLHFNYSDERRISNNGAGFVYFPEQAIHVERQQTIDGKPSLKSVHGRHRPQYLAYLIKRSDGRYEPVGGQYDADRAFFELFRYLPYHDPPPLPKPDPASPRTKVTLPSFKVLGYDEENTP